MDFSLSPELRALRDKTRQFIAEQVIPLENDERQSHHGPSEALRNELVARARAAGLLTPHASREMGGLGLTHVEKAVVFEEAGYSWLGPTALNIHAPDEGNIHLMEEVATPAQKERWLRPQVAGEWRSCFAMTEPAPGAGADPSMLQATAVRRVLASLASTAPPVRGMEDSTHRPGARGQAFFIGQSGGNRHSGKSAPRRRCARGWRALRTKRRGGCFRRTP